MKSKYEEITDILNQIDWFGVDTITRQSIRHELCEVVQKAVEEASPKELYDKLFEAEGEVMELKGKLAIAIEALCNVSCHMQIASPIDEDMNYIEVIEVALKKIQQLEEK